MLRTTRTEGHASARRGSSRNGRTWPRIVRIVQESLTNTLKHAGTGTSAEVTLAAEAGEVRIKVADTGTPPGASPAPEPTAQDGGPGHGLVGIRQRAAMYGGTVIAGPRDTGHGRLVDVVLDVPTAPAQSAPEAPGAPLR
ncbi:ATP-binding protein [Streptomyces turgidiscabies]|uniref:histidine kinase n=1 Tax=Streptomyces turgidiscabies (strain Car8) TaxID=698760 RepID=L7F5K2_STRT8|nr:MULTISPECIES: ATP-binding protein [Streptomyces]ELP66557.1 ATPase/histidine kinase/DNA gyrase B/HSP90 domain protein [Streptomyces turgidiscabies Car8]MDX3494794.1 ATP-binding protein [Streptomyces turgidiscabies]GAQ71402.1 histidine kinase-, DNA gyrase B-, and HSP90-like ATPase [Streptomyces turgidiscabies]